MRFDENMLITLDLFKIVTELIGLTMPVLIVLFNVKQKYVIRFKNVSQLLAKYKFWFRRIPFFRFDSLGCLAL